jgi:hypothetical protein
VTIGPKKNRTAAQNDTNQQQKTAIAHGNKEKKDRCRKDEFSREMDGDRRHKLHMKELLLEYLRGRGTTTCLECACNLNLPPILREYASAQDIIGWENFVMEMVSHKLPPIQNAHFHTAGKSYHATGWIAGLIMQLLQVTHTQWIYRCMLVHDRTRPTSLRKSNTSYH